MASLIEKVLYFTLFWIPLSGLSLLFLSGEERDIAENNEWQSPYEIVDDDMALGAHIVGNVVSLRQCSSMSDWHCAADALMYGTYRFAVAVEIG